MRASSLLGPSCEVGGKKAEPTGEDGLLVQDQPG